MTHLKRSWCWERLRAGGQGDDRGRDGWMASLTLWTWVWVDSGNWWWIGRPGVLGLMGLQRVRHDWTMELNWTEFSFLTKAGYTESLLATASCLGIPTEDPQEAVVRLLIPFQSSLPWSCRCSRITMSSGQTLPRLSALWRDGPPEWQWPAPTPDTGPTSCVSNSDLGLWTDSQFSAIPIIPTPAPNPSNSTTNLARLEGQEHERSYRVMQMF